MTSPCQSTPNTLTPHHPITPSASSHPATRTPRHPVTLTIELFGVPRLLAGERTIVTAGETLGELAADLARRGPELAGRVLEAGSGWPLDGYSFVVDEQFTRDRARRLQTGTSVLLVASAAGG